MRIGGAACAQARPPARLSAATPADDLSRVLREIIMFPPVRVGPYGGLLGDATQVFGKAGPLSTARHTSGRGGRKVVGGLDRPGRRFRNAGEMQGQRRVAGCGWTLRSAGFQPASWRAPATAHA